MYCTKCGKKLKEINKRTEKTFDRETGKPIFTEYTLFECADFQEGWSDRYWHVHDRIIQDDKGNTSEIVATSISEVPLF